MATTKTIVLESSSSDVTHLFRTLVVIPYEAIVTLWAFLIFWLLMVVTIPIAWTLSKLHPDHPRSAWMLFFQKLFRIYLYLAGVRLVMENAQYLPKEDEYYVFAANHASFLDGMLWGAVYGRRAFTMTMPPGKLPWPFELWAVNMGNIPVARDEEERTRFPDLLWGEKAVKASDKKLITKKKSMLIFPEGHVERQRKVRRFHTGAVRIALETGVPLVPVTIRNAQRVFAPNKFIMWPGTITFRLHKPLDLEPYYGKQHNRPLVRQLTERLRRAIVRDMPEYYKKNAEGEE